MNDDILGMADSGRRRQQQAQTQNQAQTPDTTNNHDYPAIVEQPKTSVARREIARAC
jgi:hypothetical protein